MHDVSKCPQCNTAIALNPGFVQWCDACDWNISLKEDDEPKTVWEKFYKKMSTQYSERLFQDVLARKSLKPENNALKVFGYVFAAFVLLIPVLTLITGIYLLVALWPNIFAIATGLLLLGITFVMRPRISPMPKNILPRERYPALYEYSDAICSHLGCAPLDGIEIDNEYNAGMGRYGFKRERIMTLGLPMWHYLKNDEKTALLGHEIAHNVNGDPNRNFVVLYAVNTLQLLYYFLRPEQIWPSDAGIWGIGVVPFNVFLRGFALLPLFGSYVLLHIFWQNSQRAEYYADYLSTKVCGKEAAIRSLKSHYYDATFRHALHSKTLNPKLHSDLFTLATERYQDVPELEIERRTRIDKIKLSRVDVTHPPTWHRIEFLKNRGIEGEELHFQDELFGRIEEELQPFYTKIADELLIEYRDSLYHA
jgi:Zn-dependent protease with chaperone function